MAYKYIYCNALLSQDLKGLVQKTISYERGTGGGKPVQKSPYHDIVERILGGHNVAATGIDLNASGSSGSSSDVVASNGHFMELPSLAEPKPVKVSSPLREDTSTTVVVELPASFDGNLLDEPEPKNLQSATRPQVPRPKKRAREQKAPPPGPLDDLYADYLRAGIRYFNAMAEKTELEVHLLRAKQTTPE
ncbi:hypothetical protein ElyMa_000274800 [Elysia marginata]|uniref:Uncharacterized protein n=1 Tax=Elysia marginata TaxID=1093978 RepID=A0AAV4F4N1_9GAST|nr:hypothetical protein ElyMa_000274800 [Elysia marginata]